MGFLTRYDGELREPLVRCQGSQVSMGVATGSASLLLSHGRGIRPQDASKKDSPVLLGLRQETLGSLDLCRRSQELVRVPLRSQAHCGLEGTLGTPVVLVLWKRASS